MSSSSQNSADSVFQRIAPGTLYSKNDSLVILEQVRLLEGCSTHSRRFSCFNNLVLLLATLIVIVINGFFLVFCLRWPVLMAWRTSTRPPKPTTTSSNGLTSPITPRGREWPSICWDLRCPSEPSTRRTSAGSESTSRRVPSDKDCRKTSQARQQQCYG